MKGGSGFSNSVRRALDRERDDKDAGARAAREGKSRTPPLRWRLQHRREAWYAGYDAEKKRRENKA